MLPKPELRGQPFTMRPALDVDGGVVGTSTRRYDVRTPGYEDWEWVAIIQKPSGWRVYVAELVSSYSLSFGHGGHTVHEKLRAIRSSVTGQPLGPYKAPAEALHALQEAFWKDEVMPC